MSSAAFARDVVIIGGCGRVGLPLGIVFASRSLTVTLYDLNAAAIAQVNAGQLPFREDGAGELLAAAVRNGRLVATADPARVGTAEHVIVVGTRLATARRDRPTPSGGPTVVGVVPIVVRTGAKSCLRTAMVQRPANCRRW